MKTIICSMVAFVIIIAGLAYARQKPLTTEQRMAIHKRQLEERKEGLELGEVRPSRFSQRQGIRPTRTSIYIAIAVDERYLYLLDRSGRLSKIAKSNITMADYKR